MNGESLALGSSARSRLDQNRLAAFTGPPQRPFDESQMPDKEPLRKRVGGVEMVFGRLSSRATAEPTFVLSQHKIPATRPTAEVAQATALAPSKVPARYEDIGLRVHVLRTAAPPHEVNRL